MAILTIIIPCYNCENWIEKAISSVASQTLKEIEILCINDGSTDATKNKLKYLHDKDQRIKIIDLDKNFGVSAARNIGLKEASGDLVFFLDPDDLLFNDKVLESLVKTCYLNNQNIVGGSLVQIDFKTKKEKVFVGYYKNFIIDKEGWVPLQEYQFCLGFYRFLYKKDFLIKNRLHFPNLKRYQDPPFLLNALVCNGGFYGIPVNVYTYQTNLKGIKFERSNFLDLLEGHLQVMKLANVHNLEDLYNHTLFSLISTTLKNKYSILLKIFLDSLYHKLIIRQFKV